MTVRASRERLPVACARAGTVDAEPGALVWAAVRPEKIAMARQPPASSGDNCLAATVVDIGYLGDMSLYKVRLAGGTQMKAAVANIGRRPDGEAPGFDDEVWLDLAAGGDDRADALGGRACGAVLAE